jgi:hypothetical protein
MSDLLLKMTVEEDSKLIVLQFVVDDKKYTQIKMDFDQIKSFSSDLNRIIKDENLRQIREFKGRQCGLH